MSGAEGRKYNDAFLMPPKYVGCGCNPTDPDHELHLYAVLPMGFAWMGCRRCSSLVVCRPDWTFCPHCGERTLEQVRR